MLVPTNLMVSCLRVKIMGGMGGRKPSTWPMNVWWGRDHQKREEIYSTQTISVVKKDSQLKKEGKGGRVGNPFSPGSAAWMHGEKKSGNHEYRQQKHPPHRVQKRGKKRM